MKVLFRAKVFETACVCVSDQSVNWLSCSNEENVRISGRGFVKKPHPLFPPSSLEPVDGG